MSSIPLNEYVCVCVYHVFFIHSSVDGHLGCFCVLAIVSDASVNIGVHVSFQISVFTSFKYIPRSEMFTLEQKGDLYGVKKKKINRGSIKVQVKIRRSNI